MLDPSILIGASKIPTTIGVGSGDTADLDAVKARLADDPNQKHADLKHRGDLQHRDDQGHRAEILAVALEIQSSLDALPDFDNVANSAARLLADAMPGHQIQIAWRKKPDAVCTLIADSVALQATSTTWTAAAEEIAYRNSVTIYPPIQTNNQQALLAVAQFHRSLPSSTTQGASAPAPSIIGVPLIDHRGNNNGALIAIADAGVSVAPRICAAQLQASAAQLQASAAQLKASAVGLANKLRTLQENQPSELESIVRKLTSAGFLKQRRVGLTVAVLIMAAMFVPVPYKVRATCELQPVQRRVIAATLDGPLKSVHVRPGDNVQAGDILATIDPREVDFQLAALDAELRGAISQQKGLIAKHDIGGGEVAGLEAKKLQFQHELLSHRRQNLEIRSPLTGMVVTGDLKPSVGSPVGKGDPLFQVAPLEEMVVEIAIPESDFAHVRRNMTTAIRLDAVPTQLFHGNIRYVHPSAELIDGENVFVAEVSLGNPDGVLRPGMRGQARVTSDRHTMGWNLFHRAYHAICTTLGW